VNLDSTSGGGSIECAHSRFLERVRPDASTLRHSLDGTERPGFTKGLVSSLCSGREENDPDIQRT
jgi:hypothetical protein